MSPPGFVVSKYNVLIDQLSLVHLFGFIFFGDGVICYHHYYHFPDLEIGSDLCYSIRIYHYNLFMQYI